MTDEAQNETKDGYAVDLQRGVRSDGSYWMNDPQRYGWEVVRIMGGNIYRFGMAYADNRETANLKFIKLEEPEKT